MAFVAALTVGLLALLIAPGYSFYFDVTPKTAVLLVGTAGLLILAARRRESPRVSRLFSLLLLLNALSLAVSTALSANRPLSLNGGSWRCFGALMQCAAMLFAWLVAGQSARTVLRGVSIASVLAGVFGVVRPPGTLGGADHLFMWLLMGAFLSMALSTMETHRIPRVAAWIAAAISFASLVTVGVRAAPWRDANPLPWRDTLSMAARSPLAGYGPEVFLEQFPHFESKALAQSGPDAIYESPRNAFLDTLVAQGAPGLLLWCGLCAVGLAAAWRQRAGWLTAALAAGIVGLQFTSFILPTAVLFLTTIGLAAQAENPGQWRPTPLISAAAPLLVLALLYLAVRFTMADHTLAVTRQLLDARDLRDATAEYEAYWFWHLSGASADVWYSRSWMDLARTAAEPEMRVEALSIAAQSAARAVSDSEEPFLAWYNRAQIAAYQDDLEESQKNLRSAISAHPNWYRPHWMLAQQLFRESRTEEGRREAALAAELAPSLHLH